VIGLSLVTTQNNPPTVNGSTQARLVAAAMAAFNEDGYFGTDTNRIARRAGFAPQTFYRHFQDKLAIFLAVYAHWQAAEALSVAAAVRSQVRPEGRAAAAARALIAFHQQSAGFRRSLRLLAAQEPRVRAARVASRSAQLDALAVLPGNQQRDRAAILAAVLAVERLCDAVADGEVADQGLDGNAFAEEIVAAVARARGERS